MPNNINYLSFNRTKDNFSYAEKVENQRKIIQIIGDNVINENLSVDSQLTRKLSVSFQLPIFGEFENNSVNTVMINIVPILKNKKEFLELLLLADEQESMIDLYLERGEMFAL